MAGVAAHFAAIGDTRERGSVCLVASALPIFRGG